MPTNHLKDVTDVAGNSAYLVTFIDVDEDGRLDYLIQNTENGVPSLKLVYNNIVSDSFFIKALMLNSVQTKSDNIYGDNSIGVSFRFVVTDLDDKKYVLVGSQVYQSQYLSLQLPYSFIGIGRSNNYVETFFAATSIKGELSQRMWTPIIPNS